MIGVHGWQARLVRSTTREIGGSQRKGLPAPLGRQDGEGHTVSELLVLRNGASVLLAYHFTII